MNNELEVCYVELCEWIGLMPTSEGNTSAKAEPAAAVEEPAAVENVVQHVWQQVADGSSGQFYYYNIETQETSWDVPEGGFAAVEAEAATSDPSAEAEPADLAEASGLQEQQRMQALKEVFELFDLDGSGAVEATELLKLGAARRSLGHRQGDWTEDQNNELVRQMDTNGDGVISADEFSKWFERALPQDGGSFAVVIEQFREVAKACLQEQLIGEAAVVEPSSTSAEVVWQQHFDSGSGYYFYTQVGQAEQVPLWERPEKGRVQHVWKQVADGSSGQFYYYNTATGETKWEEPDAAYDVAEAAAPVDLFASLDVNGDGVIDKAEFAAAVSVFLLLQ